MEDVFYLSGTSPGSNSNNRIYIILFLLKIAVDKKVEINKNWFLVFCSVALIIKKAAARMGRRGGERCLLFFARQAMAGT